MEVIMKTFSKWARGMGVFFLLAIMVVVVNPGYAFAEKNKGSADATDTVVQEVSENPGNVEQGLGNPQGPPNNPGPGCYKKIHGKNAETTYKYFPHGHPEGPSEWVYVGPSCEPYGQ
jgi:hypothetical protein